jgi:ribosome-associated translation inhibitor RaiA
MLTESITRKENEMQIMVNTGHNIDGREALAAEVGAVVESALSQLSDRITRVEVHLSDVNGQNRGGRDKRCMMEARIEGRQPLAVTDQAESLEQAVEGAAGKLARMIESTFGRDAHAHDKQV